MFVKESEYNELLDKYDFLKEKYDELELEQNELRRAASHFLIEFSDGSWSVELDADGFKVLNDGRLVLYEEPGYYSERYVYTTQKPWESVIRLRNFRTYEKEKE